ncbi:MAG TPA: cysteine desulfurase [Bacilli bacterium]|nr:cysteine desulfurase [Bacilli bacterium]
MNREDFLILKSGLIYFDNAATALKPKEVIAKMDEYYHNYPSNIKRGDYDLSYQATEEYEHTRNLVKELINADVIKEIVFTSGATDSLNIIADGYFKNKLNQNDEVLITKSEHASNVLPWFRLIKTNGIKVKYIPLDENYEVTLENVKKRVTANTKVISLAQITNVVGDIRPLKEIINYAHSLGILVIVDAAQSIAHKKVNVKELDADFLVFSAHKMGGPTGIGVLYGKERLLKEIEPINLGGGMNESFTTDGTYILKDIPTRLEAGTPNIAGVIGLGKTIEYLNKLDINKIDAYITDLKKYLVSKLEVIPHINIINKTSLSSVLAFNVEGIFSQDVAFYLNKHHICVRAGNHCAKMLKEEIKIANTVRISLSFYNTKTEIDKFIDLIKDKSRIEKEMI